MQALTFHRDIVKILTMKIHIILIFKQEGEQL